MNLKKTLRYEDAHKLMDRQDESRKPIPFHLEWKTLDGRVVDADVTKSVSYEKEKGCRKVVLKTGGFRMIYDILIRKIDDTFVVVS